MLWQSPLVDKVGSAFVNGRARSESEVKIFTVGHSTRTIEEFLELLHGHGVQAIADVRTIPKSRHNPQFAEGLGESLRAEALPWRCHRSLIGDALVIRGDDVLDIMSTRGVKSHTLTSFASIDGTRLTYP